jgi:hypothetical protein
VASNAICPSTPIVASTWVAIIPTVKAAYLIAPPVIDVVNPIAINVGPSGAIVDHVVPDVDVTDIEIAAAQPVTNAITQSIILAKPVAYPIAKVAIVAEPIANLVAEVSIATKPVTDLVFKVTFTTEPVTDLVADADTTIGSVGNSVTQAVAIADAVSNALTSIRTICNPIPNVAATAGLQRFVHTQKIAQVTGRRSPSWPCSRPYRPESIAYFAS